MELRPTAYAIEEKRYKIPDDVPSVNWQQQANLMSLAGSLPASPLYMDHYLPDSLSPTLSPSSSTAELSSTTSPTSPGNQKEQMELLSQGPELSLEV